MPSKKPRTIALPRPKGTRSTSRTRLVVTMHPDRLRKLERLAVAASMSLTSYVDALLDSDGADVAPRRKTFSLAEIADVGGPSVATELSVGGPSVATELSVRRERIERAAAQGSTIARETLAEIAAENANTSDDPRVRRLQQLRGEPFVSPHPHPASYPSGSPGIGLALTEFHAERAGISLSLCELADLIAVVDAHTRMWG